MDTIHIFQNTCPSAATTYTKTLLTIFDETEFPRYIRYWFHGTQTLVSLPLMTLSVWRDI